MAGGIVSKGNVMLTSEYAKPIGIVSGMNPRASMPTAWKNRASFSECVSYKLDADGNKVDARVFTSAPKTRTTAQRRRVDRTIEVSDRMAEQHESARRLREIIGTNNIGSDYS